MDIWLCGGGRLAGAFLPEIDELITRSYPVIAGAGRILVDGGFRPTAFTATDRKRFSKWRHRHLARKVVPSQS